MQDWWIKELDRLGYACAYSQRGLPCRLFGQPEAAPRRSDGCLTAWKVAKLERAAPFGQVSRDLELGVPVEQQDQWQPKPDRNIHPVAVRAWQTARKINRMPREPAVNIVLPVCVCVCGVVEFASCGDLGRAPPLLLPQLL